MGGFNSFQQKSGPNPLTAHAAQMFVCSSLGIQHNSFEDEMLKTERCLISDGKAPALALGSILSASTTPAIHFTNIWYGSSGRYFQTV